jgi:UPF0176 protein
MSQAGFLPEIRDRLKGAMRTRSVKGTIILADEGYNGAVCGVPGAIGLFISDAEAILKTRLNIRSSYHAEAPFRRIDVKIKPEIVTLQRRVDLQKGNGTHVPPSEWNRLIEDDDVLLLDTRNRYEFKSGTFRGAIDPGTEKFSELPDFVHAHLDPEKHKKVAMFCTGGIRCEKFAPYLKELGFAEVYQLEGGILRYLEEIPSGRSLWEGECFVFDRRISLDHGLKKGRLPDHSQNGSDPNNG